MPQEEKDEEKKHDDVDEGYFDSSFVDTSDCQTVSVTYTDIHGEVKNVTDAVSLLSEEFKLSLSLSQNGSLKRRRIDACSQTATQADNHSAKLLDQLNKHKLETDTVKEKLHQMTEKFSASNLERLSLLVQTETLQTECLKSIDENKTLKLKINQKDCKVLILEEALASRDKEIDLLQQKEKCPIIQNSIHDYRQLEMLRVDNIRLLHDNRSLTATLDSLTDQLSALRRIGRNYIGCRESVLLMNEKLAEDNSALVQTLNAAKKELRALHQEKQDHLIWEESQCTRGGTKRRANETFGPPSSSSPGSSSPGSPSGSVSASCSVVEDNASLARENVRLKESVAKLKEEVEALSSQLKNVRSLHNAFNKVLSEKTDLQKQLETVEARNEELWARVVSMSRTRDNPYNDHVITENNDHVITENNVTTAGHVACGESDVSRKEDEMIARVAELEERLSCEVEKNAESAQKIAQLSRCLNDANLTIHELQNTVDFLQDEHSIINEDMGKKLEDLEKNRDRIVAVCRAKLKDKTRKLNASRIKLGYALLEARESKLQEK